MKLSKTNLNQKMNTTTFEGYVMNTAEAALIIQTSCMIQQHLNVDEEEATDIATDITNKRFIKDALSVSNNFEFQCAYFRVMWEFHHADKNIIVIHAATVLAHIKEKSYVTCGMICAVSDLSELLIAGNDMAEEKYQMGVKEGAKSVANALGYEVAEVSQQEALSEILLNMECENSQKH